MSNIENIDRYLGGEMASDEMQQFENALQQDPVLNKEFTFQQEIVEGLKTARLAEIKAGLNTIDVSGLATSGVASSSLLKLAGAAAVIIGGAFTYYTLTTNQEVEEEVPATTEEVIATEQATEVETDEITTHSNEAVSEDSPKEESQVPEEVKDTDSPNISISNVSDNFEDDDADVVSEEAPTNELINKSKLVHATIGIEIDDSKKKYGFHYQVKNGTLFLYGKFDKIYEVIEFNHNGESDLFLQYDSKYYGIEKQQTSIVALEEIINDDLVALKLKINASDQAKGQ